VAYIQQKRDGWAVRWRENGRGSTIHSRRFRTLPEAEAFKAEKDREASTRKVLAGIQGIPGWDDDDARLSGSLQPEYAVETYLRRLVETDGEMRVSTQQNYDHILRNHIEGTAFGRADIRTIAPEDVEVWWSDVKTTRRGTYVLVAKGFNAAVRAGLISASPLARTNIKRPGDRQRPEDRPLTTEELERLADGATSARNRLVILLLGYCGLRAGEVGGLCEQDIHFGARPRLVLQRAALQLRHGRELGPLKTASSRRTVALPAPIADELSTYLREHKAAPDGRVFHNYDGIMTHKDVNYAVHRAAKRAGLPPVHAHQLRHTAVSLLIDDGANPKDIQAFVGHANIRETLQTYGHLFSWGGERLADSMARRIAAARNGA
jgi:integrase